MIQLKEEKYHNCKLSSYNIWQAVCRGKPASIAQYARPITIGLPQHWLQGGGIFYVYIMLPLSLLKANREQATQSTIQAYHSAIQANKSAISGY